jgi:hypothetical protein
LDPVNVQDRFGTDRNFDRVGDLTEVCHASGVWGDITGDGLVNSGDALIALSFAVGLSTGGFNLAPADVDADGQVTSRDALAMLSAGIDLPTDGFRVNKALVDACAPEAQFPRNLYFVREGPNPGVAGSSGLAIRAPGGSVTIPGGSADANIQYDWRPRVSPADGSVLFICFNAGYPQVCKANPDGSGQVNLTPTDFDVDQSPDWSPAGDSIVFVSANTIWVMAADGSGAHQMPLTPGGVEAVSWQPQALSRTVAYASLLNNGEVHTVLLDGLPDVTVYTSGGADLAPRWVDWNQGGDSLLFDLVVDNARVVAAVSAFTGGQYTVRVSLPGGPFEPAWTDEGVLFATFQNRDRLYVRRPDGSMGVVGRDPTGNSVPGMKRVP